MSYEVPRHWGVTAPISVAVSSAHEIELDADLLNTLQDLGLFENEHDAQKRVIVLEKLNQIVKEFVFRVSRLKGMPEADAKDAGGKIFTFGSYHLGAHMADADLDTLCVVPRHVERDYFFTVMYDLLKEQPEVTDLTAVVDAYVPVIKMNFSGIPIDFVCARLELSCIPDDLDLSDNNLLRNLDERCVRALNGSRVADEILRLIPNIPVFRTALRTIKFWAKRRAIYSNVMGFFGGVAWALLVARICQLFPNACGATIVSQFFQIMHKWKWPTPVLLKHTEVAPLEFRVWDPELYPADKSHRMPIITPVYPAMCATHNVTYSTMKIMIKEFKRGAEVVDRIFVGSGSWIDLFEKSDFFHAYKHYLQVIACSTSPESQLEWSGLVESRIRQLLLKLELNDMLFLAHPYIHGFERIHYCLNEQEKMDVSKGIFVPERTFPVGEGNADDRRKQQTGHTIGYSNGQMNAMEAVYTTTFYIGLFVEVKPDRSAGPRKLNLAWPVQEFNKLVRSWEKFDSTSMNIVVKNLRSNMLPPELLNEERRLKRPQRKVHRSRRNHDDNPQKVTE
ncbi:Poly(A) polymerase central domain-containing protein [Phascolomyces articulosus]|uniref:Poly(A) polymerase n=1 Tax=Phascolomyces articulosus TaxID=60185 RepID=A0AAD5K0F9_9FUNG|nr:Poly(A) polymerase central domain-containing protein [Phascolomyces articulosus]